RVSAALRMRADALPVVIGHQVQHLHVRLACAAESVEGGRHVALVVTKLAGVLVLVVALNNCIVLDKKLAQPRSGKAFAIAEMMHDLARTPFAREGMRSETVGRKTVEGVHDFVVSFG